MIIDLVIIALVALSVALGYQKGLIKLAVSLIGLVISIVVTVILYNPIANIVINTTNIDETIEDYIYEKVLTLISYDTNSEQNYLGITVTQAEEGMLPVAAREMSIKIVKLVVFVLLIVITKIVLRFINGLADVISKVPLIKQCDKLGGVLYGILRGVLVIYIVLVGIEIIGKTNPQNIMYQEVNKTTITKYMYENNVINLFLK